MEIMITVFKESGKYYYESIVRVDKNIPIYEKEEFKKFIRENNPANIGEGFIVTKDMGTDFHTALWRYEEVYN